MSLTIRRRQNQHYLPTCLLRRITIRQLTSPPLSFYEFTAVTHGHGVEKGSAARTAQASGATTAAAVILNPKRLFRVRRVRAGYDLPGVAAQTSRVDTG